MIERNIHQTAPSFNDLPIKYKNNIEEIKKMNPGWKYFFYDDFSVHNFIKSNFDEKTFYLFNRIDKRYGAAKADLFRYLVVYKYGGLYLDIKSTSIKPLESVITESDKLITSNWPEHLDGTDISHWGRHKQLNTPEFQNWFILSESGNEILQKVIATVLHNIENYCAFRDGVGRDGVLSMTGPVAFTKVLQEKNNLANIRIVSNEEIGLKYSIFGGNDPKHIALQKNHYTKNFHPILETNFMIRVTASIYFMIKKVFTKVLKRISQIRITKKHGD